MAMSPPLLSLMFLFLSTLFSATTICFPISLSYSHHCASLVPESTPTVPNTTTTFPHLTERILHNYDNLISSKSEFLSFKSGEDFWFSPTQNVFETDTPGVHMIEAYLFVPPRGFFPWNHEGSRLLRFELDGFWSEYSGKLCMVGSASWYSRGGNLINLDAVLKLNYAMNLTIFSGLITGKLESLASPNDPNYFEPVPMLEYVSSRNYKYSLVSGQFDCDCHGGIDTPKNQSLGLHPGFFCSTMMKGRQKVFTLEYLDECSSSKNCTPLGKDGNDELPTEMTLKAIHCSEEEQKVQYVIKLGSPNQPFDPSRTLIGEAFWDEKKNQLCIVACRLLSSSGSQEDVHIGDCSIRLSLRYPAFWSIWNRTSIVGQIWTNKTSNDVGYFHRIGLKSLYNSAVEVPGLSYKYLITNKVRKLCPLRTKTGEDRYPKGNSHDLAFSLQARGYGELQALPNFVGDQVYERYNTFRSSRSISTHDGPLNVSYTISQPHGRSSAVSRGKIPHSLLHISAEGLYDEETGSLCMVGCRKISTVETDCEILFNFQFEPVNAKKGGQVRGSIERIREETEPLYFKQWEAKIRSIPQSNLEIVMALISNTLACVFVGLQILYVKKNPQVLPFISLVMLLFLILVHMIPLLLDVIWVGSGGWAEGAEVTDLLVRALTVVAFLLQFRLLLLAFSARLGNANYEGLWVAEMKALHTMIYIVGLLFILCLCTKKQTYHNAKIYSSTSVHHMHYMWGNLVTCGGLVVDGFLLPQILFNVFQASKENALSPLFYIGTTCVRLLPRAYDLYLTKRHARLQFYGAYVFANPNTDIYSSSWYVVFSHWGVLFAVVIFLQQRFGGRSILPRRFREVKLL